VTSERVDATGPDLTALPLFAQPLPTGGPRASSGPRLVTPLGGASHSPVVTVDWSLVAALRAQASEQLSQAVAADRVRLDKSAQQELGRSIVLDLIEATVAERVNAGDAAWPLAQQNRLARAVFDSLFRLGRLQPLVDDDRVENIIICGHDNVMLELIDGSLVEGPPVADSDEELVDFLVFLASRSEVNARGFSEAQPRLHLRLDGGSRLAAAAWVTPRPSVVIRRHRLMEVTLDDLVERQMLSTVAASFLRAAVTARKSIVVAGQPGRRQDDTRARLVRRDRPPGGDRHLRDRVRAAPARAETAQDRARVGGSPGSGERGPDGRQAGEFTLDEALVDSFRFNLSRQIVGEVRGKEIWAMIKAMESGTGSISTTHASDAVAAVRKLVTCAMEAGPHVTQELATSKLAATIDLIVQLDLRTSTASGVWQRRRRVAEIIALTPGERETGYATTHVFAPDLDGRAVPAVLPDEYRKLTAFGFDLPGYLMHQEASP
jgi:Flp pilus assembly CpaF family ATPase